jgi:hypothetical protein
MSDYTDKTHFFRDDDDNRTVVVTAMIRPGFYKAFVIEGANNELDVRGYGDTRMAAIANLHEAIQEELDQ